MQIEKLQSPDDPARKTRLQRWLDRWPVLLPLLLVAGLLWVSLWYSRRAQLLEDASHVEFEAPTWTWLEAFAGPEVRTLIGSPTSLHLSDGQTTSANLRIVAGFDELTDFAAPDMTDADLEYLAGCTKLQSLSLQPSSITDAGVASLSRFGQLEHLTVTTDRSLTEDVFSTIEQLSHLKSLRLEAPEMTDVSLAPFSSLRKLDLLRLTGATIRGDDLKHLTGLGGLRVLDLINCRIEADGLAALQPSLSGPRLGLYGSNITDEHIPAIEQLTWLLFVSLADTQVSDKACLRLKQARPGIHIQNARNERVRLPDRSL